MKEIAIGIDIGGTNTVYGVIDRKGNTFFEGSVSTNDYNKPKDLATALHRIITEELMHLEGTYVIRGIGIGAPNGNYYNGTIEFAPNLIWKGVINLNQIFSQIFQVPVVVTNDANAAAMGELMFGAAKKMKDFIMITLGTGVGSGFVANGKIIYGKYGFAGELGHTIISQDGRECACGRKGCLETYASVTGIVRTAQIMLAKSSRRSHLREIHKEELTGKIITNAARKGDTLALEIFDYTAKKLGFSLANAVAITNPEAIILFGGLAHSGDLLLEPTRRYLEETLLPIFRGSVKLIPSELQHQNAAVLGAAAIVWKEFEKKNYNASAYS